MPRGLDGATPPLRYAWPSARGHRTAIDGETMPDAAHGDASTMEAHHDAVLSFDEGIPGFRESRRFRLTQPHAESAFQVLESLDEDGVALLVTEPWLFFPDYTFDLPEGDREALALERPEDAVVVCAITVDGTARTAWANLRAPFVLNAQSLRGRQVVLDDEQPLRATLPIEW